MKYIKIAQEINKMAKEDQEARKNSNPDINNLDNSHTTKMQEIINTINYPTIPKVGKKASFNAWLIIQHSPSLLFQEKCLELMEKNQSDVDPKNIAYLKDRVLMRKGKPQIYGTQVRKNPKTKKYELYPVEDLNNLDPLRKSIGLEPILNYLKSFKFIGEKETPSSRSEDGVVI